MRPADATPDHRRPPAPADDGPLDAHADAVAGIVATIRRLLPSEATRRTLALYWFDGLLQTEIADAERVTQDAISKRIAAGSAALVAAGVPVPRPPAARRHGRAVNCGPADLDRLIVVDGRGRWLDAAKLDAARDR